jgi:hypothetical protein
MESPDLALTWSLNPESELETENLKLLLLSVLSTDISTKYSSLLNEDNGKESTTPTLEAATVFFFFAHNWRTDSAIHSPHLVKATPNNAPTANEITTPPITIFGSAHHAFAGAPWSMQNCKAFWVSLKLAWQRSQSSLNRAKALSSSSL